MTKQNLIDTIIDFLASDSAGDSKGVYHPETVKVWMTSAFNRIIYNAWRNGKKYNDFSQVDAWSKTYTVDVVAQCGARAYCLLPFAPMSIPDGMSIRQLRSHYECSVYYGAAIGAQWLFAPIEATANAIFDELEVSTMDNYPTYRIEQSNVNIGAGEKSHMLWLEKLPIAPDPLITSVDILIVQNLEQMDDFDDVVIPENGEDDLMRTVIDIMSKKPKADTLNDQNFQPPIQ